MYIKLALCKRGRISISFSNDISLYSNLDMRLHIKILSYDNLQEIFQYSA